MEKNIESLLTRFNEICLKRWVEGVNNSISSVGLTFEQLLGKEIDSEMFPDYRDIEIKCSQRFSNFPLFLFNKTFDGPLLFETNDILQKYGTFYSDMSDKKYLFVNLKINEHVLVNDKYYFLLRISYIEEKIFVGIYDLDYHLLDEPFVEFNTLETHIKLKLKNLALIYASKKEENDLKYFRYYLMIFYKLKSVDNFYKLIEKDIIKVSISCRASFDKNNMGKQKNKGLKFNIAKKDLDKLFDKIIEYNADEKIININSDYYFDKTIL